MHTSYHILNGDALLSQFPKQILGEKIIARACLVDGDVDGQSLDELYQNRAQFIARNYEEFSEADYFSKTVTEFNKIKSIPKEANINLWFEQDLFCQVNMWFIFHLLKEFEIQATISLVMPSSNLKYGFGSMSTSDLEKAYHQKINISNSELTIFQKLWRLYQYNHTDEMLSIVRQINNNHPYLIQAIQAHIERIPSNNSLGRPIQSLIQIMKELEANSFGPVFQLFCQRESIYGFGDLQVKRMYDKILFDKLLD